MVEMRLIGIGTRIDEKRFRHGGSDVTEGQLKLGGSAVNRGIFGGVGLGPGAATNQRGSCPGRQGNITTSVLLKVPPSTTCVAPHWMLVSQI
jgi:hypothetical protein